MRYWAYLNNKVCGPVEAGKLKGLEGFAVTSLICPETTGGAEVGWKAAETYPEVLAVLNAPQRAAGQPRRAAAESPLAMTMRGTLIEEPAAEDPAPAPAAGASRPPAESPLAMTMRGTLIDEPPAKPATPVSLQQPAAKTAAGAAPDITAPDALAKRLDQMSAMLVLIANGQSQLLERLGNVESSVLELKAQLQVKKN
jgi:hypothetical protein